MTHDELLDEARATGWEVSEPLFGRDQELFDPLTTLTVLVRAPRNGDVALTVVLDYTCEQGALRRLTIIETVRFSQVLSLRRLVRAYATSAERAGFPSVLAGLSMGALEDLLLTLSRLSDTPQPLALAGFIAATVAYTLLSRPQPVESS